MDSVVSNFGYIEKNRIVIFVEFRIKIAKFNQIPPHHHTYNHKGEIMPDQYDRLV